MMYHINKDNKHYLEKDGELTELTDRELIDLLLNNTRKRDYDRTDAVVYRLSPRVIPITGFPWYPEFLEMLERHSANQLSEWFGITPYQIKKKRKQKNIKFVRQKSQSQKLKKVKIKSVDLRFRQWSPEEDAMLGKISSYEIAEKLGIKRKTVDRRRKKLGIAPYTRSAWKDEYAPLLGTKSDKHLGEELGIPPHTIGYQRRKRGIAKFKKK